MIHKDWVKLMESTLYTPIKDGYNLVHGSDLSGVGRVREFARKRDNHTCQKCGKIWQEGSRRFDVHHLDESMESIRDYLYDRSNLDKLITYCHKCHLNLHSVRKKMRYPQKLS
jgi:hypothetical protein